MNKGLLTMALIALASPLACAQSVTITFWHSFPNENNETKTFEERVLPAFEKANPGIKVRAERVAYDDLRQKLLTSVAGGTGPDVAYLDVLWTPEFASLGALEPLNNKAGFANLRSSVAFPAALATNVWKGQYYGLPQSAVTQAVLYNPELLQAAGVGSFPKTTNEFKTYLTKLQKKQGNTVTQYGFAVPGPYAWYLLPWIWSLGGNLTDPGATRASGSLNSPQTVAALNTMLDLYKSGLWAPTINRGGVSQLEGMGSSRYAAIQEGNWAYGALTQQNPNLALAATTFPKGPGGSVSVLGGGNLSILKDSKNKEAAWKFLSYMLSPEAQRTMAEGGQIPVVKAALSSPALTQSKYLPAYLEQLKTVKPRTVHPNWPRMEEALNAAFLDIFDGKKTAQAALNEAAAKIDPLLK